MRRMSMGRPHYIGHREVIISKMALSFDYCSQEARLRHYRGDSSRRLDLALCSRHPYNTTFYLPLIFEMM
jgi:hypothetical protein